MNRAARNSINPTRLGLLLAVVSLAACQGTLLGPELHGVWGGEHVLVTVTDSGATLVFDCASGTMSQRPDPDDDHRFDVPGTWIPGTPVFRDGQEPDIRPARYRGRIDGRTMRFTITLTASGQLLTAYQATLGEEPNLVHCQ